MTDNYMFTFPYLFQAKIQMLSQIFKALSYNGCRDIDTYAEEVTNTMFAIAFDCNVFNMNRKTPNHKIIDSVGFNKQYHPEAPLSQGFNDFRFSIQTTLNEKKEKLTTTVKGYMHNKFYELYGKDLYIMVWVYKEYSNLHEILNIPNGNFKVHIFTVKNIIEIFNYSSIEIKNNILTYLNNTLNYLNSLNYDYTSYISLNRYIQTPPYGLNGSFDNLILFAKKRNININIKFIKDFFNKFYSLEQNYRKVLWDIFSLVKFNRSEILLPVIINSELEHYAYYRHDFYKSILSYCEKYSFVYHDETNVYLTAPNKYIDLFNMIIQYALTQSEPGNCLFNIFVHGICDIFSSEIQPFK